MVRFNKWSLVKEEECVLFARTALRETQTHGSSTKRDTDTRLQHKEGQRHTTRTLRDTDTRLEHQERHRHTAQTPRETQTHTPKTRGTQTHGSNTKRDTETRLEYKRNNTDTEEGHSHRQIQGLTVRVILVQYMCLIVG